MGEVREIDDVVEWIQDTVNQTLCQFAHSSHLLLPNQLLLRLFQLMEGLLQLGGFLRDLVTLRHHLLCAFCYYCLQSQLLLPQFMCTIAQKSDDQSHKSQQIGQQTIPF